jgi:two-component sensor histidine kinase
MPSIWVRKDQPMFRKPNLADGLKAAAIGRSPRRHFSWDAARLLAADRGGSLSVRIAIGLASGMAVLILRAALVPFLGEGELLISLFPLLVVATVAGGVIAGGLCLAIGLVGGWYWFMGAPESFALAPFEGGALAGSLAASLGLVWLCNRLRVSLLRFQDAAENERILARELAHRIKNVLQLVSIISRHTFADQVPIARARGEFEGRIAALADANTRILESDGGGSDLRELITAALAAFGDCLEQRRVRLDGPRVALEPDRTVPLMLAIHELATNAMKYGALSAATGLVEISWTCDPAASPAFRLHWRETGGPTVRTPDRRGFGSQLIERNLAKQFGGSVALRFPPEGVEMTLAA